MKPADVTTLLRGHADPRGIEHWKKHAEKSGGLKSFGIGLTQLRKLAKEIGRDHELAAKLWKSDYYDVKIIGLLIDDPKQITPEQAERQVGELQGGYLSHVFAACDSPLAKTTFAFDLASRWIDSSDTVRRRCGYSLFYELSKKNPKGMTDDFLLNLIARIEREIHGEEMWVREAMNSALFGIGKRNLILNKAAVAAAKKIGPVDIDYGDDNSCEPLDVLKHLTSESLLKRLSN